MSYRQCRNLIQMLRSLNYPRLISLQNFIKPNFELIADILYWLTQRYDPQAEISDNINQEKDRIQFMKTVITIFTTKARIKLNPRRLYQADGEAVQQLLKITTILYKASNAKGIDEEQAATFSLPTKVSNLKSHKILSNEICDLGARLYDAVSRQPQLKAVRNQALSFLQGMSGVNSENDQAYIQNCVKQIMQQQNQSMQEMTKYVSNMERDQKNLQQKFKKKSAQLERAEKRYRNLITVKPAFMQEYQRLQQQLEGLYQVYVDRYRNIDYLENQLERFNQIQRQKQRRAKIQIQKVRKGIQDQIHKGFINDQQLDDDALLLPQKQRGHTRGNSRKVQRGGRIRDDGGFKESDQQQQDDDQDDQQSGQQLQDDQDDDDSNF